jgi:hypothetical protein
VDLALDYAVLRIEDDLLNDIARCELVHLMSDGVAEGKILLVIANESESAGIDMRVVIARVLVVALLLQMVHLVNFAHAALLNFVRECFCTQQLNINLLILIGGKSVNLVEQALLFLLASQLLKQCLTHKSLLVHLHILNNFLLLNLLRRVLIG